MKTSKIKKDKSKTTYFFLVHLKFLKMETLLQFWPLNKLTNNILSNSNNIREDSENY